MKINKLGLKSKKYRTNFSKTVYEIMDKNEKFLMRNFKPLADEVVELSNDAIDYTILCTNKDVENKTFGKSAFNFYICQVLLPESHALFPSLLIGNLPACFRSLRFMTEMMAKCYLADINHPEDSFFGYKIEKIHVEETGSNKRVSEVKFIKDFDNILKTGNRTEKLWRELSNETHGRKFTKRVLDNILNKGNVPGYSLMIPMVYTKGDIGDLGELRDYILDFQKILSKISQL